MKTWIIFIIIILLVILGFGYIIKNTPKLGPIGSAHEHADFKVYINGELLNFAQMKYMVKDRYVHIENMNGNEIHKHATGVTLGYFFKTLGYELNENCFILDNNQKYCNQDDKTLKFYVNGMLNQEYGNHEIKESEKYLITYGNDSEEQVKKQIESV